MATMEVEATNPRVSDKARYSRLFAWSAFTLMFLVYLWVAKSIFAAGNVLAGVLVLGFWAGTLVLGLVANRFIVRAMLTKANGYYLLTEWADKRRATIEERFATVIAKAGAADMFDQYMSKDESANAFAIGGGKRAICLHAGLINALQGRPNSNRLIEAVIAHEVGHLMARDTTFFVVLSSMTMSFIMLGRMTWDYIKFNQLYADSDDRKDWKTALGYAAFAVGCLAFGYIVAPLTSASVGRKRESAADMFAANLGYAEELQEALEIIEHAANKTKVTKGNAFIAPMFFSAADVQGFLNNITRTHPHTHVRRRDLQPIVDGNQGLIPDHIQTFVVLGVWMGISTAVLAFAALSHGGVGLWYTLEWYGAAVLAAMGYYVLGMGTTTKPAKNIPTSVIVLALGILAGLWVVGGLIVYSLGGLPVLSSPVPVIGSFGRFALWLWIGLPVFVAFGTRRDLPSTLADLSAYTTLVFALSAMYIML